jgi:LDH2 family malate/lactate/ureidoglycolate dehydrogenase
MKQAPSFRVAKKELARFVYEVLRKAGADEPSARAVTRALVDTSAMGVDSHGVRLLPHYVKAVTGGRVCGSPNMGFERRAPAVGCLDADNGFGHLAGFRAIDHGIEIAEEIGVAAVSVVNSSHFGAAGCYVLAAAERGYAALAVSNSDAFVLPHDGTRPFHGTNPLAFATPVPAQKPYLLDMATSAIPWNRVQQYLTIGEDLPPEVAADGLGRSTTDPARVAALAPLGGAIFGYKGAGLAGMIEILSSALTGMLHGNALLPMGGPDFATPRHVGHFFLVLRPDAFVPQAVYEERILAYLANLREQPSSSPEKRVIAPGDREWSVEAERTSNGIPIDAAYWEIFAELAERSGVTPL